MSSFAALNGMSRPVQQGKGDAEDAVEGMGLMQAGLLEVLLGIKSLLPALEEDAGETLNGLGLFTDEGTLQ